MEDILIVGWGAVAILYGYTLHCSGKVRLTVVARSNYEVAKSGKITIASHQFGNVTDFIPERVVGSVAEAADRSYTFVLITTKAFPDVLPTSKLLEPFLSRSYTYPQPTYAILQNGLGVEKDLYAGLSKRMPFASPQIINCAVYCGANLMGNVMRHPTGLVCLPSSFSEIATKTRDHGKPKLTIGLFNLQESSKVEARVDGSNVTWFKNLMEAGGVVTIAEDIQAAKFRKNIWNAAFATFSCLTRVPPSFYTATPELWKRVIPLFRETGEEIVAVGRAMGYSEKYLPADSVQVVIDTDAAFYTDVESDLKPSTLLDIEANKPFEVEVIVGEVVRAGRQLGVPTPRMDAIYTMLSVVQAHILKG
ncbi:hypothetical protein FRB94_014281 [Tulasnella sp. JGI-2019a]|nr:hypothetical protein FRB94_014281 [Tulasnella sp. JGI-2019a]